MKSTRRIAVASGPAPDVTPVRDALILYFHRHQRAMPWRATRDPYAIWVSEVMLQQTRVDTVIGYYHRFLARFPTVRALAEAPESDVMALWSGLGYYRRARMLHAGAQRVMTTHQGVVPNDWHALRALPGVGDYTAGAIGSIAFGLPVPVVDGNVERVLSRLYALQGNPRTVPGRGVVWALASRFAESASPGDVNQALMELGATVCTPTSPRCDDCPAQAHCAGLATGDPARFPVLPARAAPREEPWCAVVARRPGSPGIWLAPAPAGRWQGMLVPPMIPDTGLEGTRWLASALGVPEGLADVRETGTVVHVLTHARMSVRVFTATLRTAPPTGSLVLEETLPTLAIPRVTDRVLACAGRTARSRLQSTSRSR